MAMAGATMGVVVLLVPGVGVAHASTTTTVRAHERGSGQNGRPADVDDNDDQLAAYNAYLARINGPVSRSSETSE